MWQDFFNNTLADVSNIALHIIHPLTQHDHSCACLVCSPCEIADEKKGPITCSGLHLMPLATPSDLDLVKTGSDAFRQLVMISTPGVVVGPKNTQLPCPALLQFGKHLETHLTYKINFEIPEDVHADSPFHVLVFVVATSDPVTIQQSARWFMKMNKWQAKRSVLICHWSIVRQFICQEEVQNSKKTTIIAYDTLPLCMDALIHGMMIRKQRLMPKDLLKLSFCTSQEALQESLFPQLGTCLFL
jgi:hypothetical protein